MPGPRVTALIDTYNHERFIEQAIVSVLEQDFPASEMEILVVDDGSTDRTPKIVRKFEPYLRLLRKANGGQASAFNFGVAHARGEFICFLDGDDWWAPRKVREVVDAFDANPEIGAVGHGYYEVDASGQTNTLVVPDASRVLTLSNVAAVHTYQAMASAILATSRLALRHRTLNAILPIPESLVFAADAFIYTLAVAIAGAVALDRPLGYYRLHASNLWETSDPGRLLPRLKMFDCIQEVLPPRLAQVGLPRDVIAALIDPWKLESERLHLSCEGGNSWRTFRNELASCRLAYRDTSFGYKIYKVFVLGLTLLMSPARFYRLKQWYACRDLQRFRQKLGHALPVEPVRVLRHRV